MNWTHVVRKRVHCQILLVLHIGCVPLAAVAVEKGSGCFNEIALAHRTFCDDGTVLYLHGQPSSHWSRVASEALKRA